MDVVWEGRMLGAWMEGWSTLRVVGVRWELGCLPKGVPTEYEGRKTGGWKVKRREWDGFPIHIPGGGVCEVSPTGALFSWHDYTRPALGEWYSPWAQAGQA